MGRLDPKGRARDGDLQHARANPHVRACLEADTASKRIAAMKRYPELKATPPWAPGAFGAGQQANG